ncbi:hypothetical protein FRC17_006005 [Serendipita sp. 399]|nr:hypothetical protein FRC17_006005 [Serendipita sp. 399]
MSGLTLGVLIGPPVGGVLNDKLGFRAPFIFAICFCLLDLVGRFLVIEQKDVTRWASQNETGEAPIGNDAKAPPPEDSRKRTQLSLFRVIITLGRSKRAFVALVNSFIYGITFTATEPTLPLRLADLYGFTSTKVGIVYLATVVPSVFSTPITGWLGDRIGVEWITVACQMLSLPWWLVMIIRGPVALMVTSLALATFFLSGITTSLTTDLAAVSRQSEGIGYAHVFGAFNFAYSCASAVGPLIGGQVYARVPHGWTVIMGMLFGLILFSAILAAYGAGEKPIFDRLFRHSNMIMTSAATTLEAVPGNSQESNNQGASDEVEQMGVAPPQPEKGILPPPG